MPPKFSRESQIVQIYPETLAAQPRTSPCEAYCPAGNPIQKINALTRDKRYDEALQHLRSRNPFPAITGRVCPHPCEDLCNRARLDQSLSIRALERFVADHAAADATREPHRQKQSGKKLAIIGSGPAGMACAYFAALLGHDITVFEASPFLGGMPRTAIPAFWLPKDIVDREMGKVLALGVRAHTNVTVGRDIAFSEIRENHDACLIATGAGKDRRLRIPGEELALPALPFLKAVNLGQPPVLGERVAIIGGGGVALDCALTAKRLGAADVHLVCVEGEECMCAPPQAIGKARARGIDIRNSCMISRIVGREGKPSGIECFEISGFRFDDQCRLAVRGAGGETILLPADTVISAVGLMPDLGFIEDRDRYRFSPKGALTIDPATFATPVTGVFAAGDAASGGPATVAQAIGGGRRAAMAIDRYLRNKPATTSETVTIDSTGELVRQASPPLPQPHVVSYEEICNVDHYEKMARHDQPPLRDPNSRPPLAETHAGLAESQAVAEAGRCMHCGHCTACGSCVESCPGLILELTAQGPRVAYPEECWHCGCCRIACPSGAVSFEFPLHMLV